MSALLDTAIGILFTFLLVSLLVTAFTELVASWARWRAGNLWLALTHMLGAASVKRLREHGAIQSLETPTSAAWCDAWLRKLYLSPSVNGPQYVSARVFSTVIIDLLDRAVPPAAPPAPAMAAPPPAPAPGLAAKAEALTDVGAPLKDTVLALARQHGDTIETFRAAVETWFDTMMERATGWYKRKTMAVNFVAALAIAVWMDVDTLRIARVLWVDSSLRQTIVAEAEKVVREDALGEAAALAAPDARLAAEPATPEPNGQARQAKGMAEPAPSKVPAVKTVAEETAPSGDANGAREAADQAGADAGADGGQKEAPSKPRPEEDVQRARARTDALLATVGRLGLPIGRCPARAVSDAPSDTPDVAPRTTAASAAGATVPSPAATVTATATKTNGAADGDTAARSFAGRLFDGIARQAGKINPFGAAATSANAQVWWCAEGDPRTPLNQSFGWLLTAIAASLGAPFWFDTLKRLINIRGAGAMEPAQDDADAEKT